MLLLKEGVNQIYVTISELNLINNPIYTLQIKEETTKIVKNITVLDTSTNPIRYNQYQVTLVNTIGAEDLPNGIVYLNDGKHTYSIITSDPLSMSKMLSAAPEICEIGIAKVLKNSVAPGTTYTDTIPDATYVSYTGNIDQNI